MLKLLLDEHLSPRIVRQFLAKWPRARIESVLKWQGSEFVGAPDDVLLVEAHAQAWTLVTCDQATIVPLLKNWGEQGMEHGGVIHIDDRTIPPNAIGLLIQALGKIWNLEKNRSWKNRVIYVSQ